MMRKISCRHRPVLARVAQAARSVPPKYAVSQVIGFIRVKVRSTLLASIARGNAILWAALLGEGILRLDGRARRSRHQGVHPEARAGGPAPRSDESVALTIHRQVAPTLRGRVSGPNSRFERPHHQGPRLCRGILTPSPRDGSLPNSAPARRPV